MGIQTWIFHIILLPILIYASWKAYNNEPTYSGIYLLLVVLASIGFIYHSYKLIENAST